MEQIRQEIQDGFNFRLDREGTSVEVIWGCKKHRSGPCTDPRYKALRYHIRFQVGWDFPPIPLPSHPKILTYPVNKFD
jgi:hypothetical protein